MYYGRVIGTVVASQKDERFFGRKLLVVEKVDCRGEVDGEAFVAVDYAQAGPGDFVALTKSKDAAWPAERNLPVDAGIMGIIDSVDLPGLVKAPRLDAAKAAGPTAGRAGPGKR